MKNLFTNLPPLWWVKFWLCLFSFVLSIAFTLPTFLGEPEKWPGWARFLLPESRISLGLDLRGGVALTLDVDVEGSLSGALSRSLNRARDLAAEKGIVTSALELGKDYRGFVVLADAARFQEFRELVSGQTSLVSLEKGPDGRVLIEPLTAKIQQHSQELIAHAINTIRNRIDQFGVSEPSIVQLGERRISLQMPGLKDSSRAKELIGSTAQLDFRLVLNDVTAEALSGFLIDSRKALNIKEDDYSNESVTKIAQWLRDQNKIPRNATVIYQRPKPTLNPLAPDLDESKEARPYLVEAVPKLSGDMIENAAAVTQQSSVVPEAAVSLSFKPLGAKIFGELTTTAFAPQNAPHQIAIVLDQNIQSAPVVNQPILNGNAQITMGRTANFDKQLDEAKDLALVLKSGALPATVKVVEERQVGPSEGQENIRTGLISSGIAAVLVVVMMVWVYGNSGIVANFAMFFNVLCILGFLAAFGATLTLPGIAGIVLTMAVAVDGNVIINERIREEIRLGSSAKQAFFKGYDSSFVTLVDAHITSAVAGVVLLTYGNPAVKGFAVTLLCGIVSTLFTSYYVTEVIGQWLVEKTKIKRFS